MDQPMIPTIATERLASLVKQAEEYIDRSVAPKTQQAHASDFRLFRAWCETEQLTALPAIPQTVALYAAALANRTGINPKGDTAKLISAATVVRYLASIATVHRDAGYDSPCDSTIVKRTVKGIKNTKGVRSAGKSALMTDDLKSMLSALDTSSLKGARDSAILLVGHAAGMRRSEIVSLDFGDVDFVDQGMILTLRRSKTDQSGEGAEIGISFGNNGTCPVRSLRRWIERSEIVEGPLFRKVDRHGGLHSTRLTGQSVALVVKAACEAVGIDPSVYSGHSLRSGHATQAAANGAAEHHVAEHLRHKSVATTRRYFRRANLFTNNTSGRQGY